MRMCSNFPLCIHTHTHTKRTAALLQKNIYICMRIKDINDSDWTMTPVKACHLTPRPHKPGRLLFSQEMTRQRVVTLHLTVYSVVYWGIMTFMNATETFPTTQQTYVGYRLCCIMGRISELFDCWSSSRENLAENYRPKVNQYTHVQKMYVN